MLARSSGPATVTPPVSMVSPGTVASQLPPVSAARSTITLPGFMPATIAAVTIFGAGRPGHRGGADHHIDAFEVLAEALLLFGAFLVGELRAHSRPRPRR